MENILIPLFVFTFIYLTIKMFLDHKKATRSRGGGEAERSLEMNELKTLIREAVQEAQVPLLDRIEALEGRFRELPSHEASPVAEALPPKPLPEISEPTEGSEADPPRVRGVRKRHR